MYIWSCGIDDQAVIFSLFLIIYVKKKKKSIFLMLSIWLWAECMTAEQVHIPPKAYSVNFIFLQGYNII